VRNEHPNTLTAITLLYNADKKKDCTEFHEYKMNDWVMNYITENIRQNVDLVLLSYYENSQDCPKVTKDPTKLLDDVFVPLRRIFNNDKTAFGFGEIAYKQHCFKNKNDEYDDEDRNKHPDCRAGQKDYVDQYYKSLDSKLNTKVIKYRPKEGDKAIKFIGGYFYWYFLQDMVLPDPGVDAVYDALKADRVTFRNTTPPSNRRSNR
jgi:hypothetical protein